MTTVLGLNAYHGDAAACLVRDGKLVAAAEEERFRRSKHWAGFPSLAIEYCLAEGGLDIHDVDSVAINSDSKASLARKLRYVVGGNASLSLIREKLRTRSKRAGVDVSLGQLNGGTPFRGDIHRIEHHLAHLGSAFLVSPYERSAIVSVDGLGDFSSAAWGVGEGADIRIDGRVHFPHSLGIFYQALTQYLGFPNYGDEYKLMGLASYGEPEFLPQMRQIVNVRVDGSFRLDLKYFRHGKHDISHEWDGGMPAVSRLWTDELIGLLGPARDASSELTQRDMNLASSVQAMYEEAFFALLNVVHNKHRTRSLTLAGGCAMNSVANGKIRNQTPFENVYVQSAAGDAGGAIGSAFVAWHRMSEQDRDFTMDHAYWGPSYSNSDINALVQSRNAEIQANDCSVRVVSDTDALTQEVAAAIADGQVIGWFQGRMEWGPRALGNRSILGDPRRADMKDILNLKIKRRESFRPFAPSVLRESSEDWFETDDDVPFMMKVASVKPDCREHIPAVTHVDGTGRLQTVTEQSNSRYHQLITAFKNLTGVPMVLNTSFNENEPVVCKPAEALDCFLRTKMDLLVMEDQIIQRKAV